MLKLFVVAALAPMPMSLATPTVLVTGATGRTGSLLYDLLKQRGVEVRAFVRNATKARDVLGCSKCDASEGIFVGDVTDRASLESAVNGVTALAVVTSAIPVCKKSSVPGPPDCSYPQGAYPIDIDFKGGKNQIAAFATQNPKGQVVLCSSMGTTNPDSFLEKLGSGHIGFFKLNEEAFLMNSGLPFAIVKPCGLTNEPAAQNELIVGHDDEIKVSPPTVSRADVARVMAEALLNPEEAADMRFDLCSRAGLATTDVSTVLKAARYPWQQQHIVV